VLGALLGFLLCSQLMAEVSLSMRTRNDTGSPKARRLRKRGLVPGVLYGPGISPRPVEVDARELREALSTEDGINALLRIDLDGEVHSALARELQRDPVRRTLLHVDFHVVRRDQVVAAEVPLHLVGDAVEVHHADGIVDQQLVRLAVKALPGSIPSQIEVDISSLAVGSAIRVADIVLPEGVEADVDPETVIVIGVPPRVSRAEEAAEDAAAQSAGQASAGASESSSDEG
jgi:large subunit ribosomal protein L25